MDNRTSKMIWRKKNTSHWTNIKYYPRSRPTILCYVRRLKFWHRRSLITMEQIKWILFQQTQDYLDKLNLDSLHLLKMHSYKIHSHKIWIFNQMLLKKNIKAAPDKSHFFSPCKFYWTHYRRKYDNYIKIPHKRNHQTSSSIKKTKSQNFFERLISYVNTSLKCNYI